MNSEHVLRDISRPFDYDKGPRQILRLAGSDIARGEREEQEMANGNPLKVNRFRSFVANAYSHWCTINSRLQVAFAVFASFGVLLAGEPTFAQSKTATRTTAKATSSVDDLLRGNGSASSLSDLKILQDRIQRIAKKAITQTVAIQVGRANGSGVIVSEDGYILTAAHVAGEPNRDAIVVLSNGEQVRGVTLGLNEVLDAGMVKITQPGKWPYAELGDSSKTRAGQWCLATGHPGGYDPNRAPVLRMGRVIKVRKSAIITDCTLVGGDSGGPLFDVDGKVIAVHSRIGKNLAVNVHVPVERYRIYWDRLTQGDAWDRLNPRQGESWIGIFEQPGTTDARGIRVGRVIAESPAESAGIRSGDALIEFAGVTIDNFKDLRANVRKHEPGDTVKIQVSRDGRLLELELEIGSREERQIQR